MCVWQCSPSIAEMPDLVVRTATLYCYYSPAQLEMLLWRCAPHSLTQMAVSLDLSFSVGSPCPRPLCLTMSSQSPPPPHTHTVFHLAHRVLSVDVASKKVNLSMKDDLLVGSDDEGDVDMEGALPGHKVRFCSLLPSSKRPSLFSLKSDGPGGVWAGWRCYAMRGFGQPRNWGCGGPNKARCGLAQTTREMWTWMTHCQDTRCAFVPYSLVQKDPVLSA
jgi:hypothetical protein